MLVLVETPAGYGLFRVAKAGLLSMAPSDLYSEFETVAKAQSSVALEAFAKFKDTKDGLAEATALIESKLGKGLKKFLKKNIVVDDQLAVADKQLGALIKKKLGIEVVLSDNTHEIIRGIRTHLHDLVSGLSPSDTKTMALSLSHTLNRFKLKFSPEKVDTMVIQAVGLLDDLDKELNNFAMRLKEWYGWHFPELPKIITDNVVFAKAVKAIGFRRNVHTLASLSKVLPEEVEKEVRVAAEVSMGTDITEEDLENIFELCERVIELAEYRASLADYLKFRMDAIAPNLTHMVGELVGARLVSHAGSLMGLAKHPASTVQILGAEKALFRALKSKSTTPKYGLIYHAQLVGQTAPKLKGKISRVLAAKLALCIRVDALGDQADPTVAIEARKYVELKLEYLTTGAQRSLSQSFAQPPIQKYQPVRDAIATRSGGLSYDTKQDEAAPPTEAATSAGPAASVVKEESDAEDVEAAKALRKKAKKAKRAEAAALAAKSDAGADEESQALPTEGAEETEESPEEKQRRKLEKKLRKAEKESKKRKAAGESVAQESAADGESVSASVAEQGPKKKKHKEKH